MEDTSTSHAPWTVHLAAALYTLPLAVALLVFPRHLWAFPAAAVPLTALVLVLIYYRHGRFRQLARLYLLFSVLLLIGTLVALKVCTHPAWLGALSYLLLWNGIAIVPITVGAIALTPASTNLWLSETIWNPIYPKSILPQAIEPVEEPGEEGTGVR